MTVERNGIRAGTEGFVIAEISNSTLLPAKVFANEVLCRRQVVAPTRLHASAG